MYGEHLSDIVEENDDNLTRNLTPSQKYERALDERFRALMNDMESLFQGSFGLGSNLEKFLLDPPSVIDTKSNLCLLIDPELLSLPWESLSLIDQTFNGLTCRDFSFHLLNHRLNAVSINGGAVVSGGGFKLLIDPWGEDNQLASKSAAERMNLKEFWNGTLQSIRGPTVSTMKWRLLRESNGLLSAEDFALSFDASSATIASHTKNHALLINCFGRLGSIWSPKLIATMDLAKVGLLVCWEGGHCETSFRRQNSTDVLKSRYELELEDGVILCALLSLAGVSTIVSTMWTSPIRFQHRFAQSFLKTFTDPKKDKIITAVNAVTSDGTKLKRWIKYSRVLYGLGTTTYSDG